MEKQKGTIKYTNKNKRFGRIIGYDKNEYHFWFDNYENGKKEPIEKELVEFEIKKQENKKQKDLAINIRVIDDKSLVEYLKNIVLNMDEDKYDEFCDTVRDYAEILKNHNITTSKIRNIYSRIMNSENLAKLKILRPRFAYISGRESNNKVLENFMMLLDYLVKNMEEKDISNFKKFMESIVAYRKYVGSDQ